MTWSAPRPRLPLVAVLCVLVSGLLLAAARLSVPSAAPRTAAGARVGGPAGTFVVGSRWTPTTDRAVLYYADGAGRPLVGLAGAVVADAGSCAGLPTSSRGFAGLATSGPGSLAAVVRDTAAAWAGAVTGRSPPVVRVVRTTLADGAPAVRATLRLRTRPAPDPCLARRVVLDVVATGSAPAVLVLVRDVDPAGIGAAEAEAVVQSLRSRT